MASAHSLPANPQLSSILFQRLPKEIRLTIFAYLLRPSASAITKGHFVEPDSPDDRAHLSAQLLRCCQQMSVEGELILYTDNRLRIVIEAGCIIVGDGAFHTMYQLDKQSDIHPISGQAELTLAQYGARLSHDAFENVPVPHLTAPSSWLDSTLPAMAKMRNINVHLRCTSRRELYDYMRLIRDIVKDKQVVVYWELDETVKEKRAADLLRSLHLWKCRTLEFRGLPRDLLTTASTIRNLVTGQTPVLDLWQQFHSIFTIANLPKPAQYILTNNIGESDDDDSDEEDALVIRMSRDRHRRHGDTREELTFSTIPITDIAGVWKAIRRGDTTNFTLWEREFSTFIARLSGPKTV